MKCQGAKYVALLVKSLICCTLQHSQHQSEMVYCVQTRFRSVIMFRVTVLALMLTATAVTAQTNDDDCDPAGAAQTNDADDCAAALLQGSGASTDAAAAAAAAEGVTGFVPLIAPALGGLAAAAGVAAAAGGGSTPSTTSTVNTN